MKKIFRILFVIVLAGAFLAACAGDDDTAPQPGLVDAEENNGRNNGENDEVVTSEPSHWDTLGERNFERATFTIIDANPHPHLFHNVPTEEFTGDALNDATINRNFFIEETFNVNIEYVHIPNSNQGTNMVRQSVLAEERLYDMVISRAMGGDLATLSMQGHLQNLAGLPYLSLESPWWSRLIYQNLQFGGSLFFTMGDIVPSMYQAPFAMFFNKQMMQDRGIAENPYELVAAGQWTLDALERISRDVYQDVNLDGTMHAHYDIFGIITQSNAFSTNGLAAGVGLSLSTTVGDEIIVDFTSHHAIERITRLTEVFGRGAVGSPQWGASQDDIITVTFHSGRAMFLVHLLESGTIHLRDMEQDYGVLPLPKFNEQQASYISPINPWNGGFVAMPLTADSQKSAFIMEAMSYASYNMIRPQVYDVVLQHRVARDEESARMIDLIIETSYLSLNGVYNWAGSNEVLWSTIFGDGEIVSGMEAIQGRLESDIESFIQAMRGE